MPLTPERMTSRIVLVLAGLASLGAFVFAAGQTRDQREIYDRFFLYLPASSLLLVLALVATDVCIGIVARRSRAEARVIRTCAVLAVGLIINAVLVAAVLLLWLS